MEKKFNNIERKGLPGGPNEQFTYITGVFSTEGYKSDSPDVNNPFNIIDSGNITMKGVDFPVMGTDNLGNSQMMMPGGEYQFPGDQVFEVRMAQDGIEIPEYQDAGEIGNAVIFAESPMKEKFKYNIFDKVKNIPSELIELQSKFKDYEEQLEILYNSEQYETGANKYVKFLKKRNDDLYNQYNNAIAEYEGFAGNKSREELAKLEGKILDLSSKLDENRKVLFSEKDKISLDYDKEIERVRKLSRQANRDFHSSDFNPKSTVMDSTFYKEAENLKKVYAKLNPNSKVDIINIDGNADLIRDGVANLDPNDSMYFFGHSGDRLGGVPNEEIAEIFAESNADNCYLGSCNFEDEAAPYRYALPGKNLQYRGKGAWWGVNPNANSIEDAMWSRVTSDSEDNSAEADLGDGDAMIIKPEAGKDYKKQNKKQKKGGSVSWDWKGKSYSGTLIPSMETESNRYARTKNGKIKTLPKAQKGATISQYEEPAWYEKAVDYLASPMTAFGYSARNQDLPDSIPIYAENRNAYDMAIDMINPFAWAKYAASADRNLDEGEYLNAGFDALGAIPIVPAWLARGKNVVKNAPVDKFRTLPGIESKQLIKVVDGQFSKIDYQHLIPTADEISDIAKRTRERLLTDKFIKNNMKATGNSRDEIIGFVDDYVKEFETSVLEFNRLPADTGGLYTRGKITIDPTSPHINKNKILGTLEHEIEHMFSDVARQGSDLYKHPVFKLVDRTGKPDEKLIKNIAQPFEQQVRFRKALSWLEKNADLKPGGNVTDDQVKKLTDAITNWSKESGKDFAGTGGYSDVQHLFSSLDVNQFLKEGQYLMPGARQTADITKPNIRKAIKDILNKTYAAIPVVGAGTIALEEYQDKGEVEKNLDSINKQLAKKTYNPYRDIDKKSQTRRTELTDAINFIVNDQGGDKNLRDLLTMTAFMENSYGANPDAYGRDYTRGPMSIDDVAFKHMFEIRKGANDYTQGQKRYIDWFKGMGYDLENMDKYLRDDIKANVAAARYQYGTNENPLPSSDNPKALYDYYMDTYNRTGEDHYDRFLKGYNEFIGKKEFGGSTNKYLTYKKFINGDYTGNQKNDAEKVYDKLNRIHYRDAKQLGMSPQNYIMTNLQSNS